MDVNRATIESMIRDILTEKLGNPLNSNSCDFAKEVTKSGVALVKLPTVQVSDKDLLDTKHPGDIVYTKDVLTLEESPRLGAGIMVMKETTFDWTLNYDEIDYVIEGSLTIIINGQKVTAGPGEMILIPKGSAIQFSVPNFARFLYVTYPADWAQQG